MTSRKFASGVSRTAGLGALALAAALGAASAACGSSTTSFPSGLEPWETPNQAVAPAATATDAYPEFLGFVNLHWTDPASAASIVSVHARGYLQVPITAAFRAARDPQTGFDPTQSDGFTVTAYDIEPAYRWTFRTHVTVHAFAVVDWFVDWRHGVVEGTEAAPLVTASRWQKTSGNAGISVLEGSLVLRAVEGHPGVTAVEYQYHLSAPLSSHSTVHNFLTSVFGRLRDAAHGRTLSPIVCMDCVTPPAGY
ncbi:MAG: hypothetical protein WCJ30_24885 [Deltaproteobacteria bacterium]